MRAATTEQDTEAKIRIGFVALILQLACSLYGLDPETHCKEGADKKSKGVEVITATTESPKKSAASAVSPLKKVLSSVSADTTITVSASKSLPGQVKLICLHCFIIVCQISCVASSKLISPPKKASVIVPHPSVTLSPVKNPGVTLTPVKGSFKTVIPTDVMEELDKIPDISVVEAPSKTSADDDDDVVEILDSPKPEKSNVINLGASYPRLDITSKKPKSPEVVDLDGPESPTSSNKENQSKNLKDASRTIVEKTDNMIVSTFSIKEKAAKAREAEEKAQEEKEKAQEEKQKAKKEAEKARQAAEKEARKEREIVEDKARKARKEAEEEARKAKLKAEEEARKVREIAEEADILAREKAEKEAAIKKAKQDEIRAVEREKQKKEDDVRNAVSESMGRLIQVVIKKMSKDDYNMFTRKVSKSLNSLNHSITDVTSLKKVIDTKRRDIQADDKNVFVHVKVVFDELKKYRKKEEKEDKLKEPETKNEEATTHVFRWMDGNDNPAEGDMPAIVIENANEDDEEAKGLKNGANGLKLFGEEGVVVIDPLKPEEKQSSNIVHASLNIKEKLAKERKDLEDAVEETMEHLISETEKAQEKEGSESCGKRKAEEEAEIPVKKKACLTLIGEVPDKQKLQKEEKKPEKKTVPLTLVSQVPEKSEKEKKPEKKKVPLTLLSKVPEKTEEAKEMEPEKEKPNNLGGSSSTETSDKKKVSQKHIDKLEAALKKCHQKIQEYEDKEVDWDNEEEEESNYLMTCRLKSRCIQIYKKIAEAKELSDSLDRKADKRLKCTDSRYPEINKKIEKFVNRTKQFPDFTDIKKLVKISNKSLHLSEGEMRAEAESIFLSVGKTLKKRRELDDHEVMTSYLKEDETVDPAAKDEDLEQRLQTQVQEGNKKMEEYMDNFYKESVRNPKSGDEKEGGEGDQEEDEVDEEDELDELNEKEAQKALEKKMDLGSEDEDGEEQTEASDVQTNSDTGNVSLGPENENCEEKSESSDVKTSSGTTSTSLSPVNVAIVSDGEEPAEEDVPIDGAPVEADAVKAKEDVTEVTTH